MTKPTREPSGEFGRSAPIDVGPAVAVGAVTAEPKTRRQTVTTQVIALVVAVVLSVGGIVLAVGAFGSNAGSPTPEAAVRSFLASLSAEDLLGAAEVILPSERDTLIEGGVRISEELIRLEVFSPLLDLESLAGVSMRFDNLTLRSVPIHPDITQVFIEQGSTRASVDVAALALGASATGRLNDSQLVYQGSISPPFPPTAPIAVVRRDGRWYVSLLYSIAESVRIGAHSPPPLASERLVAIGADSPEAVVERLIREIPRLDPRVLIGLLDPNEMAVLYDYASVYLAGVETAANEVLQDAADAGRTWRVDSVELSSESKGDVALVAIGSIETSFGGPTVDGSLLMAKGRVVLDWTASNLIGKSTETQVVIGNGCTTVSSSEIGRATSFNSCDPVDDTLGPRGIFKLLVGLGSAGPIVTSPAEFTVVTTQVDGRWFVAPTSTGIDVLVGLLQALDAGSFDDALDLFPGLARIAAGGLLPSLAEAGLLPFSSVDNQHVADFDVTAADLVNRWAPSDFAVDLVPIVAKSLMTVWLPEARGAPIVRAVEVESVSSFGGTTVFVFQLADAEAVVTILNVLAADEKATINGSLIEMGRPGRDSVVVAGYSDRLVVATGLRGTPIGLLRTAASWQLPA